MKAALSPLSTSTVDEYSMSSSDSLSAKVSTTSTYQKHMRYDLSVDPMQNDKATTFNLKSYKRPHMRAFWLSNIAHRCALLMWFSINPLLPQIQESLDLSDNIIGLSIVSTLSGSLISRLIAGFVCDKYGARIPFTILLLLCCIPTLFLGSIQNGIHLIIVRFFVGFAGGAFVFCHFWVESMFTHNNSGFIHGFAGGIGVVNAASNFTIGIVFYPLFSYFFGSKEIGWRLSFVIPVLMSVFFAFITWICADDTPKGNYSKLKKEDLVRPVTSKQSMKSAFLDKNVWLFGAQYACNFGVEIVLYNTVIMHLQKKAGLGYRPAVACTALACMSNQILRTTTGRLSDRRYEKHGLDGRLKMQRFIVALSGICIFIYSFAVRPVFIILNLFMAMITLSAAQGSMFSLVPLFNTVYEGSAIGVIGAIGNLGALLCSTLLLHMEYEYALMIMGGLIIVSSSFSVFMTPPSSPSSVYTPSIYTKRTSSMNTKSQKRVGFCDDVDHVTKSALPTMEEGSFESQSLSDSLELCEEAQLSPRIHKRAQSDGLESQISFRSIFTKALSARSFGVVDESNNKKNNIAHPFGSPIAEKQKSLRSLLNKALSGRTLVHETPIKTSSIPTVIHFESPRVDSYKKELDFANTPASQVSPTSTLFTHSPQHDTHQHNDASDDKKEHVRHSSDSCIFLLRENEAIFQSIRSLDDMDIDISRSKEPLQIFKCNDYSGTFTPIVNKEENESASDCVKII